MPSQEQNPIKITLTLPTHAYFTTGVRDFTFTFIKNATHFGEKWAYRFQSIVDELCNNAIEFGSEPGKDIKITFYYDSKNISVSVEDTGTGKIKMSAENITKLVEERKQPIYVSKEIRGRGLSKIVANWTDELKFENIEGGGIKVTATKNLETPQAPLQDLDYEIRQPNNIVLQI